MPNPNEQSLPEPDDLMRQIRAEVLRQKQRLQKPARPTGTRPAKTSSLALEIGRQFTFGCEGNANGFLREGWSAPEPGFIWSADTTAALELPQPQEHAALLLHLKAFAFTYGALVSQVVRLYANNELMGEWNISREACYSTLLAPRVLQLRPNLLLRFDLPLATSPKSVGAGVDARQLGIALRALSFHPVGV